MAASAVRLANPKIPISPVDQAIFDESLTHFAAFMEQSGVPAAQATQGAVNHFSHLAADHFGRRSGHEIGQAAGIRAIQLANNFQQRRGAPVIQVQPCSTFSQSGHVGGAQPDELIAQFNSVGGRQPPATIAPMVANMYQSVGVAWQRGREERERHGDVSERPRATAHATRVSRQTAAAHQVLQEDMDRPQTTAASGVNVAPSASRRQANARIFEEAPKELQGTVARPRTRHTRKWRLQAGDAEDQVVDAAGTPPESTVTQPEVSVTLNAAIDAAHQAALNQLSIFQAASPAPLMPQERPQGDIAQAEAEFDFRIGCITIYQRKTAEDFDEIDEL